MNQQMTTLLILVIFSGGILIVITKIKNYNNYEHLDKEKQINSFKMEQQRVQHQESNNFVQNEISNQKKHDVIKDKIQKNLNTKYPNFPYLEGLLNDCGELCDTTRSGTAGLFFDEIVSQINCDAIFNNDNLDISHNLTFAPESIPDELLKEYTMNGRLRITRWYFNNYVFNTKTSKPRTWSKERVDRLIENAKMGVLIGSYGIKETSSISNCLKHTPGLKNGRVLVIGSRSPWLEAICIANGAAKVVTLEYGNLDSKHPQITTMVPSEFRKTYQNGTLGLFDAVVTFSSIEHSGLGRYGDAMNPWGDIMSIARAWCVTKQGGGLLIGVPFSLDNDELLYNAHRVYGKIRYPYLTTNWKQVYQGKETKQKVHVFVKEPLDA